MAIASTISKNKGKESGMGGADAVNTPVTEEFEDTPDLQLPTFIGTRVGASTALGRAVGVPYNGGEVWLEQLGEMGEYTDTCVCCGLGVFFY